MCRYPKYFLLFAVFFTAIGLFNKKVEAGGARGGSGGRTIEYSPTFLSHAVKLYSGPNCSDLMLQCVSDKFDRILGGSISGSELDRCIEGPSGTISLRKTPCSQSCSSSQERTRLGWSLSHNFGGDLGRLEVPIICDHGTVTLDDQHCRPNTAFPHTYTLSPPNEGVVFCYGSDVLGITFTGLQGSLGSLHACVIEHYFGPGPTDNLVATDGSTLDNPDGFICATLPDGRSLCLTQVKEESGNCRVRIERR